MDSSLKNQLIKTAKAIVAPGRGILAADESFPTIEKRFKTIDVASTEESRRSYREILFTTAGVEKFISGVILFDETIRQKSKDKTLFPKLLSKKGIIPGIKVDKGAKLLAGTNGEKITEGLDGLAERLAEYYSLGARFTKWRAVIKIGQDIPTDYCIGTNAHALARFAALSQEAGLVPIVEPEVLMDGDHTIVRCEEVTTRTLHVVFNELYRQKVLLEGMLLKPNMVISGKECSSQATPAEIAQATLHCFYRVVPSAVPGIVFLSGGQSDVEATVNLNEMNKTKGHPWELSFSYGRALQAPVLATWRGLSKNVKAAQAAFYHRAKMNSLARFGKYSSSADNLK